MKNRLISISIVGLLVIGGFAGLFMATDQVSAVGPTYVSGSITMDTIWYLADSPYIVIGNVTVESSATLTIEPGVEVKFDGEYSIIVDGKLIAQGTSVDKIKFTSNQTTPVKGDWYTIRLRTDNNVIGYAEVEYATYGIFMTFFGSNNTISDTTIKYCKFDGVYITNSNNNTIYDCSIVSNDRYGITIYDSDNTMVKYSIIQNNKFFGINLNASTYSQIYGCNISYNDGKGILLYSNSHHTTISDCQIDCNNHIGIDLSGTSYNNIMNTRISGNNGIGIDFGGLTTNQCIDNCIIMDNQDTGIDLRGSSYVDIIGCNVSRNKGNGGIYSDAPVNYTNIINTEVWNNLAGNGTDLYGVSGVNITDSTFIGNVGNGIKFNTINNYQYNTIKNCIITSNKANGIYLCSSDTVQYNYICFNEISSNINNGIYFYTISNNHPTYLQQNNVYSNSVYLNNQNGIFFSAHYYNPCYIQDNNIHSNFVHSNNKNGIYFYGTSEPLIQNNNVYNNTIYSNQHGIFFDTGMFMDEIPTIQTNNIFSNTIYLNNLNGIYFYAPKKIENNNIYTNTIYSNNQYGIYLYAYNNRKSYVQNNNIYSNIINQHSSNSGIYIVADNPSGIWQTSYLYNNTITSNFIGIKFLRINSHVVNTNNISNSKNDGIIFYSSTSNIIRYNTIMDNNCIGINLNSSSSNNYIENNNIASNNNTGILITYNSNNNFISRNDISTNSKVGLNISGPIGNQIHHNNFKWNSQNAYDSTIALNDWDDGAEGNFWSDYLGTDDDGDGFGEDPYVISGGGSRDWHPFMYYVDISAPYIVSTSPTNGDENVPINPTISITFSKEMNTTAVESAISISGSLTPTGFVWDVKNETVTFTSSSNLASKTTYTIIITTDAKDILGNCIEDTYIFLFTSEDIEPPKISTTSPYDGEPNVKVKADIVVTFNEPMQTSSVTFSCTPDPGGWSTSWDSTETIATFIHNNFGNMVIYTFQITAGKDTRGLDLVAGPVPNPWTFSTPDALGPEITSTSPADGSQNISTMANIVVNFNEEIDIASVTFTCAPDPLGWSVIWTNNNKTAAFSHNGFTEKTMYIFHITGAKDIPGNDLNPGAAPNPWSFTTTGDYIAPQISLTSPANNAVNVELDENIIITFTESMDTSTLNYICIPNPGGWSETWSNGDTILTFSHDPFENGTTYTFHINTGKDISGNDLIPGAVPNPWLFTTVGDIEAPQIILTTPVNNEDNVYLDTNIMVTFNKAMDTSSLNYICSPDPGGWAETWSNGDSVITFSHIQFEIDTIYTFQITDAMDISGKALNSGIVPNPWSFTTVGDLIGPQIILTSPSDDEIDVDLSKNIVVTFSEEMDTSTLNYICIPDLGGWSEIWSNGNTVITFSHNQFTLGTIFNFYINTGKDISGNDLNPGPVPNPWSFTTVRDKEAPQIITTSPADNEDNVDLITKIVVTFSEAMDTSSLDYICTPDPGEWFESWDNGNSVITFSHDSFTESTMYSFQITSAKDLEGNNLAQGTIPNPWTFTTIHPKPPNIINTLPSYREIEVTLDKNIIVIFSEPMDPSTVTYTCNPDPGGWDIGWSNDNMIATFSHNPFAIGTTYNFHIIGGKDIAGNNLTIGLVPHSWNFTTISVDSLIITPSEVNITEDGTVVLIAQAYDSHNNPIPGITYVWSLNGNLGTISPQGSQIVTFKGSSNVGICYVNVTAGEKSVSAIVTIKSENVDRDITEDTSPEDIPWFWFLILVIIVLCVINLWLVLRKEKLKDEEKLDSSELVIPKKTIEENPELIQENPPEPTPPPPSLSS